MPGERIVFSGVGKTRAEMRTALDGGIRQFNVESEPELAALSEVAASMGATAPITLRVNPDVDAQTHEKIATGKSENKFGIPIARARAVYAQAARLPGLRGGGHRRAYRQPAHLAGAVRGRPTARSPTWRARCAPTATPSSGSTSAAASASPTSARNEAPPLPLDYGEMIRRTVGDLGCEVEIEPGRLISGNAGILVSRVIYVKEGEGRDFLILDAAMNDLIRPAMYGAHHDIVPVLEPEPGGERQPFDVVGPVCETGDTFARARPMPPLPEGDLVAFRSAGAYGAVMASEYNTRPLVPEVLVQRRSLRRHPRPAEL